MALNDCKALEQDICVYRNDRRTQQFTITDAAGDAVDLTGYSGVLTVNSDNEPDDETTQLFQITGVIDTPASGVVEFTPSAADANQEPDTYFYDVEITTPGGLPITVAVGSWTVEADISNPGG